MRYLIPLILLGTIGCAVEPEQRAPDRWLEYARDERTGLCFARTGNWNSWAVDPQSRTLTHVPCTPEVIRLLAK